MGITCFFIEFLYLPLLTHPAETMMGPIMGAPLMITYAGQPAPAVGMAGAYPPGVPQQGYIPPQNVQGGNYAGMNGFPSY